MCCCQLTCFLVHAGGLMFLRSNIRFLAAHFPPQMCAVDPFGTKIHSKTCEINKSGLPARCRPFFFFFKDRRRPWRKSREHVTVCSERLIHQFNWLPNLTNHLSAVFSCEACLMVIFTKQSCFWSSRGFKRKPEPLFCISLHKSAFGYIFFLLSFNPLTHCQPFIFLMPFLWQQNQRASANVSTRQSNKSTFSRYQRQCLLLQKYSGR